MKINKKNYEEFVIGYLDGVLDPVDTAELLIFLEQHPELKEEVSELASYSLKPDPGIQYGFSESLIQPSDKDAIHLSNSNFTHYFIAANEGDLSAAGLRAVEAFLVANPALNKDFELFAKARLKADQDILFPNPEMLKKPVASAYRKIFYYIAAAASILILISVFLRTEKQPINSITEQLNDKEISAQKTDSNKSNQTGKSIRTTINKSGTEQVKPVIKEKKTEEKKAEIQTTPPAQRGSNSIQRIPSKQILNKTPEPFNSNNRNFYSDLYEDIRKSQEPMLASLEPEPSVIARQPLARSKTGKHINSLIRSGVQIASQVPASINGWMLAGLGIDGINMLTDRELKLQRIALPNGQTEKVIITDGGSGYSIGRKPN